MIADGGATPPDAAPTADAGGPTPGVPCGPRTCEASVSFCLACPHYEPAGTRDAHCEPSAAEGWPFREALEEHRCGFPGVFVECDGPEDCEPGEICTFSGGEFGYGQCWARDEAFGAVACHADSDCEDGSRCGELDPLGYFSPLYDLLGWRPRACGGASPEATAFCDRYEAACGIGEGSEFYSREQCLGYLDGLTEDQQDCALTHLSAAEGGDAARCARASGPTPCTP